MTKVRRTDTSVLPAAARTHDGHTHPLPGYVRVVLVVYAAALTAALAGLFALYLAGQQEARERARAIAEELDRRTAARDAEQAQLARQTAEQDARTRQAVCIVLTSGDLGPSPRIAALGRELQC